MLKRRVKIGGKSHKYTKVPPASPAQVAEVQKLADLFYEVRKRQAADPEALPHYAVNVDFYTDELQDVWDKHIYHRAIKTLEGMKFPIAKKKKRAKKRK